MTDSTMGGISWLPLHILQRILLFLPADDAARTSVLSKTWCAAWVSLPVFNFEFVGNISRNSTAEEFREEGNKLNQFIRVTAMKLGQQKSVIEKFRFNLVLLQDLKTVVSYIHLIIILLPRNCVRELELRIIKEGGSSMFYSLPSSVFSIKSLVVLKLGGFRLKGPFFAENSKFSCLKELSLNYIYLNDEVMSGLIRCCPALEDLWIIHCFGFKHLLIPNLPRLREFALEQCYAEDEKIETISVEAEHLEFLWYKGPRRELGMEMAAFKYLKELTIIRVKISDQLFEDLVPELPLLEDLSLLGCFDLKRVKLSSHLLKRLRLGMYRSLQEATIDAPNLILYEYAGNMLPRICKFDVSTLLEPSLVLIVDYHVDTSWFLSLRQNLANFEQYSNLGLLIVDSKTIHFLPEELEEFSLPQLPVVKHITFLAVDKELSPTIYETWLDGLLWWFRPEYVTMQSFKNKTLSQEVVSFLLEKMLGWSESPQCCNSSSSKCCEKYSKRNLNYG